MYRFGASLTVLTLALFAVGCSDDDDDEVPFVDPSDFGALTVNWTIDGEQNADECASTGAASLELLIYDDDGNFIAETSEACEAFVTSIELTEGRYDARATLVGGADESITTTATLPDLDVLTNSELVVDVDFPADSFL